MADYFCTVCNKQVHTNYCGDCGQKVAIKKVTLASLVGDFFSNFFSLQNSLPATIWNIIKSPKTIINNYSHGYKNYYPSPGRMIIVAFAFAAIHLMLLSYIDSGNNEVLGVTGSVQGSNDYGHVMILAVMCLLMSLSSQITFIKQKRGFTAHLISFLYLWASFFIVFIVLTDIILLITGVDLSDLFLGILFLSILIWNAMVFTPPSSGLKVLGNILIQTILMLIIASVLLLVLYQLDALELKS